MDDAIEGYLAWARVEKGLSENTLCYARDLNLLRAWLAKRGRGPGRGEPVPALGVWHGWIAAVP